MSDARPRRATAGVVVGLLTMSLGALLTLDNFGVLDASRFVAYWPVILIAVGIAKAREGPDSWQRPAPYVWMLGGVALLGETLDLWDPWHLWPLLLVLVGVRLVWRGRPAGNDGTLGSDPALGGLAIMGGVHDGTRSQSFRSGDFAAVMGACEVDLRQASIEGEAVIDTLAFWGGIEIRVPKDWQVVTRGVALLGGFENNTTGTADGTKRLVVTGLAVMGGVEIKN